ncbi:hypothetical protein ACOSQ2_013922 [Xanthoceras sorbifolium]
MTMNIRQVDLLHQYWRGTAADEKYGMTINLRRLAPKSAATTLAWCSGQRGRLDDDESTAIGDEICCNSFAEVRRPSRKTGRR